MVDKTCSHRRGVLVFLQGSAPCNYKKNLVCSVLSLQLVDTSTCSTKCRQTIDQHPHVHRYWAFLWKGLPFHTVVSLSLSTYLVGNGVDKQCTPYYLIIAYTPAPCTKFCLLYIVDDLRPCRSVACRSGLTLLPSSPPLMASLSLDE